MGSRRETRGESDSAPRAVTTMSSSMRTPKRPDRDVITMTETSGFERARGGHGSLGNRRFSGDRSDVGFSGDSRRSHSTATNGIGEKRTELRNEATAGASRPILKRPDPSTNSSYTKNRTPPDRQRLRVRLPPLRHSLPHLPNRPYRPCTNGKAERYIQTLLRGWPHHRAHPISTGSRPICSTCRRDSPTLKRTRHNRNYTRSHREGWYRAHRS